MEQPVYTKVKVNNEIEFCEVKTMDAKEHVEKALLKARVSYYIRWKKPGFFSNDRKEKCIFHINSQQIEPAFQANAGERSFGVLKATCLPILLPFNHLII